MSDQNVRNAGFTPSGIAAGSLASSMMSHEARSSGGGVPSGGPTSTLQGMGAKGTTHSSGFTSSGISGGSKASSMMSKEATSYGGGVPRGGTTSTVQSISMGGKGGRR
ncbi:Interferon alpha-inducible protein 6 [Corvus brachyrhynchos]|uniref:Interferon alpha-inducible protein 6 n=1 Tax=Corvus brachyrhynchos TaxID=85066 RepID=A0A091FWZ6_CORBR|nr:PREDICTED: interferon alpha-inducible protein 6 [Corvus brachyrhynchos]XP_041904809.1 interferon alpha-inducible protein 6-like [Corvus kubaryi]KFO65905.1 Interferon alpha-inducible protein 6 [Corvus brachyrhynchos]